MKNSQLIPTTPQLQQNLSSPSLSSSSPVGGCKGAQERKLEEVTRIVWVHIPQVHVNQVRRYRRLYTKAVNLFLRAFRKEHRVTAKQVYHRLRKTPSLVCLPAPMLDRAGREAATWHYWQQRRRHLTHTTMKAWWQWAQKNGIALPEPQPGYQRLLSYPKNDAFLKGKPGGKQGQWPQLTERGALLSRFSDW